VLRDLLVRVVLWVLPVFQGWPVMRVIQVSPALRVVRDSPVVPELADLLDNQVRLAPMVILDHPDPWDRSALQVLWEPPGQPVHLDSKARRVPRVQQELLVPQAVRVLLVSRDQVVPPGLQALPVRLGQTVQRELVVRREERGRRDLRVPPDLSAVSV